jgi:putative glutamine amidotransferase
VKIALTNTGDVEKHGYYVQWLRQEEPIDIIKLDNTDKNAQLLDQCDALVLSGGVDIHPSIYRGNTTYNHSPKNGWYRERDEFEIALFKKARDRDMPVLAVCRGLQLVNVVLGGTLVQDLGDAGDKIHEGIYDDKRHSISIVPQTLLHELVPTGSADVNSAHHQAIDKLGTGLQVNARAADGTIEGIEWANKTGKPFLLGVQWHPERMFRFHLGDTPASLAIRNRFIEAIKASKSAQS